MNYGSLLDASEFAAVTQALPPSALAGPAGAAAQGSSGAPGGSLVLTNLPSISQQGVGGLNGSPGTCEAQSFGYGLGSYTAALNPNGTPKWDPDQPQYQVSPAWLFAWAMSNGDATCPKGGLALCYLQLLVESGAPSVADVPYNPNNYTTPAEMCQYFSSIDLSTHYPDSSNFLLGSYYTLVKVNPNQQTQQLSILKAFLDSGHAVAFSGLIAPGYGNPVLDNDVFYVNGTPTGGHGQLLVGYSDTIGNPSDPGAFLVQNSFGSQWNPGPASDPGRNGRIWYSYTSWFQTQKLTAIAYPYDSGPPIGVALSSASPGAPAASIEHAYNWCSASTGTNYLVLHHKFGGPVRLRSLAVLDAAGNTYRSPVGGSFQTGYTYVENPRGQFPTGNYLVTLAVRSGNTDTIYSGRIAVPF